MDLKIAYRFTWSGVGAYSDIMPESKLYQTIIESSIPWQVQECWYHIPLYLGYYPEGRNEASIYFHRWVGCSYSDQTVGEREVCVPHRQTWSGE